jgi:hypothetical protein
MSLLSHSEQINRRQQRIGFVENCRIETVFIADEKEPDGYEIRPF